jgi:hypothetical protein
VVEIDQACCGNCPLQASQRRRSHSLVGGELRETNPCFFVWFDSLSCFSSVSHLLQLWSTWVCYLCVQGSLPYLWSSTATHQVRFVLEVKRCLKLFLQVFSATPVWLVRHTGLTGVTCEVQCLTDLTVTTTGLTGGALSTQVFGEKKFNLVVTPIHPPLGDIKVLSPPPHPFIRALPGGPPWAAEGRHQAHRPTWAANRLVHSSRITLPGSRSPRDRSNFRKVQFTSLNLQINHQTITYLHFQNYQFCIFTF